MASGCDEGPVGSSEEWLHRLNTGKLNKSINHKIHLYSYLRDLPAKQQWKTYLNVDSTSEKGDEATTGRTEADKLPDLFLSPVILEDYTRPPRAIEEMPPLYFQPAEFFDYLLSDKWQGATSLRVMGGELLALILAALTDLEVHRMINPHEIIANLNNRQLIKTTDDSNQKMMYEKMIVQLVYYEKAEMSNLPVKIVGIADPMSTPKTVILPREIVHQPYVYRKHTVDKSKLCPEEYMTHGDIIARLEKELDIAKKNLTQAQSKAGDMSTTLTKDVKKAGGNKAPDAAIDTKNAQEATQATYTESIEYISEDPNLVKSELKKMRSKVRMDTKTTSLSALPTEQTDLASKSLANTSRVPSSGVVASVENGSRKNSVIYAEEKPKSPEISVSTLSEIDQSAAEVLNLTRKELYVTGLYEGNENNFVSCEEKLIAKRNLRMKLQKEKEKRIFEEMHSRAKSDLTQNFKHLAQKQGPINETKQNHYTTKLTGSIRNEWKLFLMDHEDCEMQIAKQSEFEDGVLTRLQTSINNKLKMGDTSKFETKASKGKPDKNKPMPRKGDDDFEKLKRDENINNLNTQLNCSNHHQRPLSEASNSNLSENDDWKNVLLPLLTFWRQHLDKGVQLYGSAVENSKPMRFRNVYFTGSGDVCSKSLPGLVKPIPSKPIAKKRIGDARARNDIAIAHGGVTKPGTKCPPKMVQLAKNGKSKTKILPKIKDTNNNMVEDDSTTPRSSVALSQSFKEPSSRHSTLTQRSKSASVDLATAISVADAHVAETNDNEIRDTVSRFDTRSKSVFTPQLNPLKPTISEQLKLYNFDCECVECSCQDLHLEDCTARSLLEPLNGYPLTLGKLRKDYKFLAFKDNKPSLEISEKKTASAFLRLGTKDVGEKLLEMINDVVIRQEILNTSLGQTFTTVTFTKPNVIRAMTSFI